MASTPPRSNFTKLACRFDHRCRRLVRGSSRSASSRSLIRRSVSDMEPWRTHTGNSCPCLRCRIYSQCITLRPSELTPPWNLRPHRCCADDSAVKGQSGPSMPAMNTRSVGFGAGTADTRIDPTWCRSLWETSPPNRQSTARLQSNSLSMLMSLVKYLPTPLSNCSPLAHLMLDHSDHHEEGTSRIYRAGVV